MRNIIFLFLFCLSFVTQAQSWELIAEYDFVVTDVHYTDQGDEWVTQQQGNILLNGEVVKTVPVRYVNELGLLAIEVQKNLVFLHLTSPDNIQRVISWNTSSDQIDTLLEINYSDPPVTNHVGGDLVIIDSLLYCSFGDGTFPDSAQSDYDLRGKIIKLNFQDLTASIFAKGFRNPFRIACDTSMEVTVADVGEGLSEEISIVTEGDNAAWPCYEGSIQIDTGCTGMLLMPVFEYSQPAPRAITGGTYFNGNYYWTDHYSGSGGVLFPNGDWDALSYPLYVTSMTINPVTSTLVVATWNGDLFGLIPAPLSVEWEDEFSKNELYKRILSEEEYEEWLYYVQELYGFKGINFISIDGKGQAILPDIPGWYWDTLYRVWVPVKGN